MTATTLVTPIERTILIMLALLICFIYCRDVSDKITSAYNESVRYEQHEKMLRANGAEEFHFTLYDCTPRISLAETMINLQIFASPILILLVNAQTTRKFFLSVALNLLTFLSYLSVAYDAYWVRKINELYFYKEWDFGTYIFPRTSSLQQIAFIFVACLLVLHAFIIVRFTAEKFNSKISLR